MSDVLLVLAAMTALAGPQDPVQAPQSAPTQLDDVEVTARGNVDMARRFVNRVAAPARGRGLGRWRKVCPGVVNLQRAAAQPIVDRIAEMADELGIEVQGPGCEVNLVIVFTVDGSTVTQAMVNNFPRMYRHGGNGIDRGTAALREFQFTERPVRWWTLSLPIDSNTGQRAVRLPGDRTGVVVDGAIAAALGCSANDCAIGAAPLIRVMSGSRLNSQIEDQINKSIIVVDIDAVSGLNTVQLGDYLAMVSLSQVDPEADTGGFDTVLNLFDNPQAVSGLTAWDRAYLSALYGSPSRRRTAGGQATAVAAIMNRDARLAPAQD